jgi:Mn-containing catalase
MVRSAVHAHAYGLALKHLTGVDMTKMLPVPNVPGDKVPEARRFTQEGAQRRLYRFSPNDYAEISAIWGNGEQALPGDPPGKLEVVDGHPDGGKIPELAGISAAFTPDYQPERSSRSRISSTRLSRAEPRTRAGRSVRQRSPRVQGSCAVNTLETTQIC